MPSVSDPMDCSLPSSSVHGIFQATVLEWGAMAFSNIMDTILTAFHDLMAISLRDERDISLCNTFLKISVKTESQRG